MEEVQKNIATFLGILKIGKTESVTHWDESNFKRAEQWARYAEEVYKKLKNKPSLVQGLVNYIKQHKSDTDIINETDVFSSLKNAKETLRQILLQNHHLSSAQFSLVLEMYGVDFLSPLNRNLEVLISDSFHITYHKGIFTTLSGIKEELLKNFNHLQTENKSGGQLKDSENVLVYKSRLHPTADVSLDVLGKLLWQDLLNIKKQREANWDDIAKKLKSITDQKKGIEILLRMVLNSTEEDNSVYDNTNVLDPLKLRVLFWIVDYRLRYSTNSWYTEQLWSCPSTLLSDISFIHVPFCKSYLNLLKSHGDSLYGRQLENGNNGCSYQGLLQRFQELLQGPEHIFELCKTTLQSWTQHLDCGIENNSVSAKFWQGVYQQVCLQ